MGQWMQIPGLGVLRDLLGAKLSSQTHSMAPAAAMAIKCTHHVTGQGQVSGCSQAILSVRWSLSGLCAWILYF